MALNGGIKTRCIFFNAGKQSLVYAASAGQKPVSHIASVCECFSVSEENYQKNGGPMARPKDDARCFVMLLPLLRFFLFPHGFKLYRRIFLCRCIYKMRETFPDLRILNRFFPFAFIIIYQQLHFCFQLFGNA